jgi:hypothetical protein
VNRFSSPGSVTCSDLHVMCETENALGRRLQVVSIDLHASAGKVSCNSAEFGTADLGCLQLMTYPLMFLRCQLEESSI